MAGKDRARFAMGAALVLSVGVGAFFGSARLAGSAPTRASNGRIVTLQLGDSAVLGYRVRCLARSDSRSSPLRYAYMRCSKRPASRARYSVDIAPEGISVWDVGAQKQLYVTPR